MVLKASRNHLAFYNRERVRRGDAWHEGRSLAQEPPFQDLRQLQFPHHPILRQPGHHCAHARPPVPCVYQAHQRVVPLDLLHQEKWKILFLLFFYFFYKKVIKSYKKFKKVIKKKSKNLTFFTFLQKSKKSKKKVKKVRKSTKKYFQ